MKPGPFHDTPGLADQLIGFEDQVREAAEALNRLDYHAAEDGLSAISERLLAAGAATKTARLAFARHLIETEARHLTDLENPK